MFFKHYFTFSGHSVHKGFYYRARDTFTKTLLYASSLSGVRRKSHTCDVVIKKEETLTAKQTVCLQQICELKPNSRTKRENESGIIFILNLDLVICRF
jgi:hypothetical protein